MCHTSLILSRFGCMWRVCRIMFAISGVCRLLGR
jgi:hypothetical protein